MAPRAALGRSRTRGGRAGAEETAVCSVCRSGDDEEGNEILLCDGKACPVAMHMRCVNPPLARVRRKGLRVERVEVEDNVRSAPAAAPAAAAAVAAATPPRRSRSF